MKRIVFICVCLTGLFSLYLYNQYVKDGSITAFGQADSSLRGDMKEKYIMVTFSAGIDYWKPALKGFEDAARALNVSVEYRGAKQYDVHEQIMVLEQAIAKKPAGIAVSAINAEALTLTINKAVDAGIPVVLFDSGASASKAPSFLGTDNHNAGVTAARKMAEILGEQGSVAVITLPNQLNHQQRKKGFIDTIQQEYQKMKVVAVADGKGNQIDSKEAALKIMNDHPDVTGIFVTEANGGVGVGEAVQSIVQGNKVKIISFDTDKRTLDMVQNGTIAATLAQGTWNMGYWSLQFLFHLQHNPQKSSEEFLIPSYVDTGISIVNKENVANYYAK